MRYSIAALLSLCMSSADCAHDVRDTVIVIAERNAELKTNNEVVGTVGPMAIRGIVSKIYPQGFTKVSSLGVEQQRVLVIINFDKGELEKQKNKGRELGVDYRVRIKIFSTARQ